MSYRRLILGNYPLWRLPTPSPMYSSSIIHRHHPCRHVQSMTLTSSRISCMSLTCKQINQLCHDRRNNFNQLLPILYFHTSHVRWNSDREPSSKVEETVIALKDKSAEPPPPKRSIWKKVKDECIHYYHGFRLLFIDIRIASRLVRKSLSGEDLSRREYRQLTRTTADIFRLVPFSIFIIVPFMEFLLPVFLKFFPGMLPSTFQTTKDKDDKIKQALKVKLDMTKFLQSTLDEMSLQAKGSDHHSHAAKEFSQFFIRIRQSGEMVSNTDILKYSKLFEDELTLDSLSHPQLVALSRLLELKPIGPDNFLRFQLRYQLKSLKSDDRMIQKEGVASLTVPELQQACRARGMRALGVSEDRLRHQLGQWLELSLNEKIPPSLLLLSRVLYLPDTLPATDQLKATIQSLPLEAGTEAKYKIGETEGKVDNLTRLEMIKQEEAAIMREEEDIEKSKKEKPVAEVLQDTTIPLVDRAVDLDDKDKKKEVISHEDIETLEDALEKVEQQKKSLAVEKEELEDIKEEMADYKEDIEEFKELHHEGLRESKAAKALRKRVDRMINRMDGVMSRLEKRKERIEKNLEKGIKEDEDIQRQKDNLVNINDIMNSIRSLQKVKDDEKIKSIIDVLDSMDVDHDGSVDVEHVVKVIEVLGREDVNLTSEQVKEVVKLVIKEEEQKKQAESHTNEKNGGKSALP